MKLPKLSDIDITSIVCVTACLLMVDSTLIGYLIVQRVVADNMTIMDLGPLAITAGALVALLAFAQNIRRGRSDDLLKASVDLLEKAYQAIAPQPGSWMPSNQRMAWLNSARLIRTSEKLSKKITEPSHQLIYQQAKEYWSARLHDLILPSVQGLPASFYCESPEHMIVFGRNQRSPLSEKSIAALYRFVRWPDDVSDPLEEEAKFSDAEITKMKIFGPRSLGDLIAEVRVLQRRSENRDGAAPGNSTDPGGVTVGESRDRLC